MDRPRGSTPVFAALYFTQFQDERTLQVMRRCLEYRAIDDTRGDQWVPADVAADVRGIAVEYLVKREDPKSFEPILRMLTTDPSLKVRAKAADALGKFKDPSTIEALAACLLVDDSGRGYEVIDEAQWRGRLLAH